MGAPDAAGEPGLLELLDREREAILDEAMEALSRPATRRYAGATPERNRERLERLHDLTTECVRSRTLIPMVEHGERIARERHAAGYDLQDVQAAINAFEEVLWRRITAALAPEAYPRAFGLVATVLGAGKEALAVEYVSLASRSRVASLDLTELFRGG